MLKQKENFSFLAWEIMLIIQTFEALWEGGLLKVHGYPEIYNDTLLQKLEIKWKNEGKKGGGKSKSEKEVRKVGRACTASWLLSCLVKNILGGLSWKGTKFQFYRRNNF